MKPIEPCQACGKATEEWLIKPITESRGGVEVSLYVGLSVNFYRQTIPARLETVDVEKATRRYCRECGLKGRVPFLSAELFKEILKAGEAKATKE
jgi:hypothetical protein